MQSLAQPLNCLLSADATGLGFVYFLKGLRHEYITVVGQFCAELIT